MVVAPVTRRIEVTGPDAQTITTGGSLLAPVSPGGDRESLGDHGRTKVATGNQAGGEQAIVLVHIFGTAIGRTGSKQLCHPVARRPATAPGSAIGRRAVLCQLGRIQTQQPDAVFAEAETVAIAGAAEPRDGRRRLIEGSRDQGSQGKHPDGQERPGGTAKAWSTTAESAQDFTTR